MSVNEYFDIIADNSHFFNWAPYILDSKDIYNKFPDYYYILVPFYYSYLEELIRSITSQYGREVIDENGKEICRKVGINLIDLAIEENNSDIEIVNKLNYLKKYFKYSTSVDNGNNRNSTMHGYMHPRFWSEDAFEELLKDIADFSKYACF